jgi:hypothetical protein
MRIKQTLCLLCLALVTTASIAQVIRRPHFLRAPSASLGSPKVIIRWTEVELRKYENVHYVASATVGATYQCVYRSNNRPSGLEDDVLVKVRVSATFQADKHGTISEEMIIPTPHSPLVCPKHQVLMVTTAVFTDIRLTDKNNDVSSPTKPKSLSYKAECED